jgi:hypothetical protein
MTDAKGPAQLQAEIEETRRELGDTVEALAEKTNVKAHAKHRVDQAKASLIGTRDKLLSKANGASDKLLNKANGGSPDQGAAAASQPPAAAYRLPAAASDLPRKAREHPVELVVAGAFAAGFLTGRFTNR